MTTRLLAPKRHKDNFKVGKKVTEGLRALAATGGRTRTGIRQN